MSLLEYTDERIQQSIARSLNVRSTWSTNKYTPPVVLDFGNVNILICEKVATGSQSLYCDCRGDLGLCPCCCNPCCGGPCSMHAQSLYVQDEKSVCRHESMPEPMYMDGTIAINHQVMHILFNVATMFIMVMLL